MENLNIRPISLVLLIGLLSLSFVKAQTNLRSGYISQKKYFQSRGLQFVLTGSYTDSSGKTIFVHAFFLSDKITNQEFREFVQDVLAHPDSSFHYFNLNKDGSVFKEKMSYRQVSRMLLDSFAMADQFAPGSALHTQYQNYFTASKYNDYPVVGISLNGARFYCIWRTLQENVKMQNSGQGLINDYRVPAKEELEYAIFFSPVREKTVDCKIDKSRSGKPEHLQLHPITDNVGELNQSSVHLKPSANTGFRIVTTSLQNSLRPLRQDQI